MTSTFPDAERVAEAAAERVEGAAREALRARGTLRLGLCGGGTPRRLYQILAGEPYRSRIDWPRARIYFADERALPSDDPESNYRLVRETLIAPLGLSSDQVFRMKGEEPDLDAAAAQYEALLGGPLDLLILGVGEDGHVASLFPGSPLLRETVRRVAAVHDSPKPPGRRLTLTPRALLEAGKVLVLATGAEKAAAVARALDPATAPEECPAALVRGAEWLLDRAAAARRAVPG